MISFLYKILFLIIIQTITIYILLYIKYIMSGTLKLYNLIILNKNSSIISKLLSTNYYKQSIYLSYMCNIAKNLNFYITTKWYPKINRLFFRLKKIDLLYIITYLSINNIYIYK